MRDPFDVDDGSGGGDDEYVDPDEGGTPEGMDREEFDEAVREATVGNQEGNVAESPSPESDVNAGGSEEPGSSQGIDETLEPVREMAADPLGTVSGVTRRQVLAGLAAGGVGSAIVGRELRSSGGTDPTMAADTGGIVYPVGADVEECEGTDGYYPATGEGAANWFHVGDCGEWKEYDVDPNTAYRAVAYTDSCLLGTAKFVIEERTNGGWQPILDLEENPIQWPVDQINPEAFANDELRYSGLFEGGRPAHEAVFSPDSHRIRIRATDELTSYLTLYAYPLDRTTSTERLGPEPWVIDGVEPVSAFARPRDSLDEDDDEYVERTGQRYRFEYEGIGTQAVSLLKRDELEDSIVYWFELAGEMFTARTDSPDHIQWSDGDAAYQFLPPTEEMVADTDLEHLTEREPPMTFPTKALVHVGYDVRTSGQAEIVGYADRINLNVPDRLAYDKMFGPPLEDTTRETLTALADAWNPMPDVPTSGRELVEAAVTDENYSVLGLFGRTGREVGRALAKPADFLVSLAETLQILNDRCGDGVTEEFTEDRRQFRLRSCSNGWAKQTVLVEVEQPKGAEGSVEFTTTYDLGPGLAGMRPEDAHDGDPEFDGEVRLTDTVSLPPETPLGRERPACFDEWSSADPPEPEIVVETEPIEGGVRVTLDGRESTVDDDLAVAAYAWEIRPPTQDGDLQGEPRQEDGPIVRDIDFQVEGEWEVRLTVTDTDGQSRSTAVPIEVDTGETEEPEDEDEEEDDGSPYFVDCFEDGNYDGWFVHTTQEADVEIVSSQPPDGGSYAVRVSNATDRGEDAHAGTTFQYLPRETDEELKDQPWVYGGLFKPSSVPDPAGSNVDRVKSNLRGFFHHKNFDIFTRTDGRWEMSVYDLGEPPGERNETAVPPPEEGRWYRWELRYDGAGKYTVERWETGSDPGSGTSITADLGEPEQLDMGVVVWGGGFDEDNEPVDPGTHPMEVDVACTYWQPLEE